MRRITFNKRISAQKASVSPDLSPPARIWSPVAFRPSTSRRRSKACVASSATGVGRTGFSYSFGSFDREAPCPLVTAMVGGLSHAIRSAVRPPLIEHRLGMVEVLVVEQAAQRSWCGNARRNVRRPNMRRTPALAESFTVIVPDRRGRGLSPHRQPGGGCALAVAALVC
jgi:hypothetical protein